MPWLSRSPEDAEAALTHAAELFIETAAVIHADVTLTKNEWRRLTANVTLRAAAAIAAVASIAEP